MGLFQLCFGRRMKGLEALPGPEPSFPMGNAGRFMAANQPWDVCEQLADEYGGICRIWLGGKPAVVLNDAALIEEVLCSRWEDFYKDAPCAALQPVITPKSLFISNLPNWTQRRADHPFSNPDVDGWLANQVASMTNAILIELAQLQENSVSRDIDLYEEIQRCTFNVFSLAFWGRVLEPQFYVWFRTLANMGSKRINSPLPVLPPPLNPLFYLHRRSWYRELEKIVKKARATQEDGPDLLRFSIQNDCPLNDAELTEAIATNFFGGVFSCSSTIISAMYLLAKHPLERETLVKSLQDQVSSTVPYAESKGCHQIEYVAREVMRYYPAVPLYFRNSSKDREVKLGDATLPKNTLIFISNWWLHKRSPHWDQPEEFRPARWADGVAEANPIGSGFFFPFGRGPRMCVGHQFAMLFIRQALAAIYRTTDANLDAGQPYHQKFYFGVMIPEGLKARFSRLPDVH